MKFWVGVTDKNWFDYLASIKPDEVNFWKPSGQGFGAIELGTPFLFKLTVVKFISLVQVVVLKIRINKCRCISNHRY